jgi:hypothetical protein
MSDLNLAEKRMMELAIQLATLLFALALSVSQVAAIESKSRIRKIDFRNFTFPGFQDKRIILKNGKQEITRECGGTIYSLGDIDYVDLTGDGREEALVAVEDFSGCGSSCVSYGYYVYTMRNNRLQLLWKYSTGCEAEGGLKDFHLEGRGLVFELFGKYRIIGARTKAAGENHGGDCCPKYYSRIRVAWDGHRFRQRSVKFFPFPYESINDYFAEKNRK